MKIIAMIPARYDSSRFEGKMLADLCGKPVIARTYDAAVATGCSTKSTSPPTTTA